MKVFTAAMLHETNRFSPIPTDLDSFSEYPYYIPGGKISELEIRKDPMYGVLSHPVIQVAINHISSLCYSANE